MLTLILMRRGTPNESRATPEAQSHHKVFFSNIPFYFFKKGTALLALEAA